mgnify:CR=1 FL=1
MEAYILDWANLLLRWLHLITGIAWIGSSFYFVWLDNSLTKPQDPELIEKFAALGIEPQSSTPAELSTRVRDELAEVETRIKRLGISIE